MKKIILMISTVVILLVFCFFNYFMVKLNDDQTGAAKFIHDDIKIETQISSEHLKQIADIFENKVLSFDSPSCGFSKDVSVIIDNKTFCIACDTCGVVYLLEKDKYFYLSDEENETVRGILKSYGFEFPCI